MIELFDRRERLGREVAFEIGERPVGEDGVRRQEEEEEGEKLDCAGSGEEGEEREQKERHDRACKRG
ncbi:MAG: hypothetical protein ACMUJJ_05405 [Roseicyclus sp.]|uniref:hypothetical protein n=1 Tax=Roseicyclus sp. TaxID=1914329 RepID=UPI003A861E85